MKNKFIDNNYYGLIHAINKCHDRPMSWKQDMRDFVYRQAGIHTNNIVKHETLLKEPYEVKDLVGKDIHIGTKVAFYSSVKLPGKSKMCVGKVIGINKVKHELGGYGTDYNCIVEECPSDPFNMITYKEMIETISTNLIVL